MAGHGGLAGGAACWRELTDEELLAPPAEVMLALVDPLLDLLPTHERTFRGCMTVMSQCDHVDVWRYGLSRARLCLHGLHERAQTLPE